MPDALYINEGGRTLLYDVMRDAYLAIAWGDWLETQECDACGTSP